MENNVFFVYGTLKSGFCRQSAWPFPPLTIQTAYVRAKLFDLGPYPGLREGDEWVQGELWTVDPKHLEITLQALDQIEGYEDSPDDLYTRTIVNTYQTDGTCVQAYAYFFRHWDRVKAKHVVPRFAARLGGAATDLSKKTEASEQTIQYSAWFADTAESQNPNS